ncbi:MOSC domain-containing protein [Xylanimonas sp. McL0601]|uniref:MOSC domain-containing protein n=1 Tax=Xylanimonas sp. McL0601 TaxID=3414739 RepID=UPI003CF5B976
MRQQVAGVRRYPVKAMGGEALDAVALDVRGVVGDRWFAVVDDDGHIASGKNTRRFRRRDAVFGYAASTDADGVFVTGDAGRWRVGDTALDAELSSSFGLQVRVLPEAGVSHFDDGAVSLVGTATLRWCEERWGIDADPRRLRANLVIETDEPFVEETWMGSSVAVGSAELRVVQRVERCRTIDLAQDGASGRGRWLKPLAAERDMQVAVYADVVVPGVVGVGDGVSGLGG